MSETLTALKELLSTIFSFMNQAEPQSPSSTGWEMLATIVAGVVVFVVCEWLKEVWLSPLQEYTKLKAKVSKLLIVHAQYYANPIEASHDMSSEYKSASCELRELASEVSAFAELIPVIHLGIPKATEIVEAGRCLIGLSNNFFVTGVESAHEKAMRNCDTRTKIKQIMKLRGISK